MPFSVVSQMVLHVAFVSGRSIEFKADAKLRINYEDSPFLYGKFKLPSWIFNTTHTTFTTVG